MGLLNIIRRMHLREKLSIREIARRTGLSRNTVTKHLAANTIEPKFATPDRPSKLDPFSEKLAGWLKTEAGKSRKQRRTLKQMHADLVKLGFTGSYGRVAAFARQWRTDRQREQQTTGRGTFVPLSFQPGEAFQFDWSEDYGHLTDERTKLQMAHIKLSHSRAFLLRAYPLQTHEMLFDAHWHAFRVFGGVPERGIYDNMKTAVDRVGRGKERQVNLRFLAMANHDATVVLAGGQESMSMSTHAAYLRAGQKMGDMQFIDTMIRDGLWDAFNNYHMGTTAENVAQKWQISRDQQDEFALASQNKAEAAQKAGRFDDEIVAFTVKTRKGDTVVDKDEYIRHGATIDAMQKLRPAFSKDGTVTAGNASGLNDGAAAVMVMTEDEASRRGLTPLARIASWSTAGLDPAIMGTGPIPASRKALEKAGWSVGDLDLVEANEAFAAQACAVNKDMGWDPEIVNVNGGAIAIGHPIGASGARVLNTLLFEMKRRDAKKGLATLCIGGGMGVAMCLER